MLMIVFHNDLGSHLVGVIRSDDCFARFYSFQDQMLPIQF